MAKRLILDKIDTRPDGILEIRFKKQILDDQGNVTFQEYHRTTCEPFVDYRSQLLAVEQDLSQTDRGAWPGLSAEDKNAIGQVAAREHTPTKAAARLAVIAALR